MSVRRNEPRTCRPPSKNSRLLAMSTIGITRSPLQDRKAATGRPRACRTSEENPPWSGVARRGHRAATRWLISHEWLRKNDVVDRLEYDALSPICTQPRPLVISWWRADISRPSSRRIRSAHVRHVRRLARHVEAMLIACRARVARSSAARRSPTAAARRRGAPCRVGGGATRARCIAGPDRQTKPSSTSLFAYRRTFDERSRPPGRQHRRVAVVPARIAPGDRERRSPDGTGIFVDPREHATTYSE
jgi:hypothetical protein